MLEKYKGTKILKVLLDAMCCKMIDEWTSQSIARELQCLHQISTADPSLSLRVPTVCGLIGSRENVLGFLMTYISPNPGAVRMDLFDMDTVLVRKREMGEPNNTNRCSSRMLAEHSLQNNSLFHRVAN